MNNPGSHGESKKQTGDQSTETETTLNTSADDTPETQTKHDQQVVPYDEDDVAMCVWGFILIHVESTQQFQSNNLIPQAIKQLIVYFVGTLWTEFVYGSDFDKNGICYGIATDYGQKPFSNPHNQGLITIKSSWWYIG
eukprot:499233_1